jgi:hypothetical protein
MLKGLSEIFVFMLVFALCAKLVVTLLNKSLPKILGNRGERLVRVKLEQLDSATYKVIHDVLIPSKNGSTQIDHIVVSPYGVFVLETKHYDGWIYGNETDEKWVQVIYKRKSKFYNPIRQNKGHIRALSLVLQEFGSIPFIPIVVFTGRGTLRTQTTTKVVYGRDLLNVLSEFKDVVIEPAKIEEIYQKILSIRITDKEALDQHIARIKQGEAQKRERIQQGVCPRCGGKLRDIQGKYGRFKACSNFPKCRFRVNIAK